MPRITDSSDDLKTLIGQQYPADYAFQEQERELKALLAVGYNDFLDELEREAAVEWEGAKEFNGILIKKACEHTSCPHFRCERGLRIGGIEI